MRRCLVGWAALAVVITFLAWGIHALVPTLSGGVATVLLLTVAWVGQRLRE